MVAYRALIVEDSIDVRRALKAALELLLSDFQVADVPSAEEGLLEFFRQPVDLLVTDFRLPGMTGLELLHRMRQKKADVKVILVTGLTDPDYRRQAMAGGASAFFEKPIDIQEFITTVRSLFNLGQPAEVSHASKQPGLPDLLTDLRIRSQAQAALLVDQTGQVMAKAGEFLAYQPSASFVPTLMTLLNVGRKLSQQLGGAPAEMQISFAGEQNVFLLAPIGEGFGILLVFPHKNYPHESASVLQELQGRLLQALSEIGLEENLPAQVKRPEDTQTEEAVLDVPLEEQDVDLDAIFTSTHVDQLSTDDLEAFWEQLELDSGTPPASSAEVLTYEEARRLGLTPDMG
jgi:DNA-binding response OmpR family regulator